MSLSSNLTDKEHGKFRDNVAGPVVAVSNADGSAISTGGGGGTAMVDKASMVEGTSSYTPSGGVFNDGLAALASGVGAWFRITASRALHVNLRDSSGNEIARNADGGLQVHLMNGGSGGTSSSFGSADPATGTAAGFSDGTNMREARVFDTDTGAGTEYTQGASLRISASGGSIEAKGQQAMASSLPVVVASDQSNLPIKAASGVAVDGWDATQGAQADAIVAAGAVGTISAKLRRVTQGLEDLKSLIVLAAGSNIIGKVGIDQTTPGTTDSVTVATGQGAGATIGTTAGVAVTTDVAGTIQQYLRGLAKAFLANVTFVSGALKVDGSAVTQPVSGTVTTTPPSNASTNLTQLAGTAVDVNSGNKSAGTLRVVLATDQPALTNKLLVTADPITFASAQAVTQSGTWTVQPGNTPNSSPWLTSNVPPSNGTQGWSFNYQSALSSTKQQIKGAAGTFGGYIMLTNPNTAETYLQVFNKTSASVTVGTTAPDFVLRIPGLAAASGTGVAANLELVNGLAMSTGITVAATTTATGSTAPTNALTATFLFL